MSLQQRILQDYNEAMRKGDTLRRDTLRFLRAALKNEEVARGRPLEDTEVLQVVQRLARQRRESIEQFRKGHRPDLVAKEEAELAILTSYLPRQLDREEIAQRARQVIEEVGARGPADKGRVMGRLMPQLRGQAEGSLVSEVVSALLEERARQAG